MPTLTDRPASDTGRPGPMDLLGRVSRLEVGAAALAALVLIVLTLAEPDVLGAPFENTRTVVFTFGGTVLAGVALVAMLWFRVPPVARLVVLGVPFVAVTWWLLSPFFIDDVADDEFSTSIAEAAGETIEPSAPTTPDEGGSAATETTTPAPAEPILRGSGTFVGLAGHDGSGDAGFFELPDGSWVLRLERFDIDNGPDLRLYVVPGADRTDPAEGSLNLGDLRGNVGDQTYEIPTDFPIASGDWTVLVWCEAFSVEFVGATVAVA